MTSKSRCWDFRFKREKEKKKNTVFPFDLAFVNIQFKARNRLQTFLLITEDFNFIFMLFNKISVYVLLSNFSGFNIKLSLWYQHVLSSFFSSPVIRSYRSSWPRQHRFLFVFERGPVRILIEFLEDFPQTLRKILVVRIGNESFY
jgi:hypothetical protein